MAARTFFVALLVGLALAACSQNRGGDSPAGNLDLITGDQIADNHFMNAFEAVQAMRSNWLQPRGMDSFHTPSEVLVYRDNVKLGGIDELRAIQATTIAWIRHYDGVEATNRWGVGHAAGVILVSSFR